MTSTIDRVLRPLPPGRRAWRPADSLPDAPQYSQGALALSYPLPGGIPARPRSDALLLLTPRSRGDGAGGTESWAALFVQAALEVIACDRPLSQLVRWTSREVYADIARRRHLVARHRGSTGLRPSRQQVATVHVCEPDEGCAEVAARVMLGSRSRAIAARFEYLRGRWVCTAIRFG